MSSRLKKTKTKAQNIETKSKTIFARDKGVGKNGKCRSKNTTLKLPRMNIRELWHCILVICLE
jgi:hypothetical protein